MPSSKQRRGQEEDPFTIYGKRGKPTTSTFLIFFWDEGREWETERDKKRALFRHTWCSNIMWPTLAEKGLLWTKCRSSIELPCSSQRLSLVNYPKRYITLVQILFAIYLSTPPKKGGTDLEKLDLHYKKIYCRYAYNYRHTVNRDVRTTYFRRSTEQFGESATFLKKLLFWYK